MAKPAPKKRGKRDKSNAFILRPGSHFRFLDLPAELRSMIHSHLLEEENPVQIETWKAQRRHRRPVRDTFSRRTGRGRGPDNWNKYEGKWIRKLQSNFAVLQVSKQVFEEAACIAYGNNKFELANIGEMLVFLKAIGSMRKYLRHVGLPVLGGWTFNKSRLAFRLLADATGLRTLAIDHSTVCGEDGRCNHGVSLQTFLNEITPLMEKLHEAHKSGNVSGSVLDIVQIGWAERPHYAKPDRRNCLESHTGCGKICVGGLQHCKDVEARIRSSLAESLEIKD